VPLKKNQNEQCLYLPPLPDAKFCYQSTRPPGEESPPEMLEMRGGGQIILGKKGFGKEAEKRLGASKTPDGPCPIVENTPSLPPWTSTPEIP